MPTILLLLPPFYLTPLLILPPPSPSLLHVFHPSSLPSPSLFLSCPPPTVYCPPPPLPSPPLLLLPFLPFPPPTLPLSPPSLPPSLLSPSLFLPTPLSTLPSFPLPLPPHPSLHSPCPSVPLPLLPSSLCRLVEKIFLKARDAQLSGDEEQAYVLFMRVGDAFSNIRKSRDYKTSKVRPSSDFTGYAGYWASVSEPHTSVFKGDSRSATCSSHLEIFVFLFQPATVVSKTFIKLPPCDCHTATFLRAHQYGTQEKRNLNTLDLARLSKLY